MGIVSSRALPAEMPAHTHPCTRWRSAKSKQKPWVKVKQLLPPSSGPSSATGAVPQASGEKGALRAYRTPESPGPTPCAPALPKPPAPAPGSGGASRDEVLERSGLEKPGGKRTHLPGVRGGWSGASEQATLAPSRHPGAAACSGAGAAVICTLGPSHGLISRYPPPKSSLRIFASL